ncbi:hypothetical protein [Zhihengliuella halotolerans]|uniref:hypothetical protein n=1 Tax=Zhihengliuella halotolerans TaxID=370736 RepID=UPI0015E086C6|nr:hypothetical protein [Zhihengliuella halotolerans]
MEADNNMTNPVQATTLEEFAEADLSELTDGDVVGALLELLGGDGEDDGGGWDA